MQESLLVLTAVVSVCLIVGVGALLRHLKILTEQIDKGLMGMTIHVFFPCLILDKMIGAEVLRSPAVVFSSAGLGLGLIIAGTAIGWLCASAMGLSKGSGQRTFAVSTGIQNYGYIAIPLVVSLFQDDDVMAVLFTHNLGVELAMWTIGTMLLSGKKALSYKAFIKGPIIAMVIGLALALSHTDDYVPLVLQNTLTVLGQCAVPLSLILIGATWYDLFKQVKFGVKISLGGIVVRLLLIPILFILSAKFLPISHELKQVLVIQASLPSAMFPILLSRHYGGRTDIAIQVVASTTVASLFTMPFIIAFGLKWLNL